jgi:hypothetical protein
MPKQKMGQRGSEETFGERLARLRQAAGYEGIKIMSPKVPRRLR